MRINFIRSLLVMSSPRPQHFQFWQNPATVNLKCLDLGRNIFNFSFFSWMNQKLSRKKCTNLMIQIDMLRGFTKKLFSYPLTNHFVTHAHTLTCLDRLHTFFSTFKKTTLSLEHWQMICIVMKYSWMKVFLFIVIFSIWAS